MLKLMHKHLLCCLVVDNIISFRSTNKFKIAFSRFSALKFIRNTIKYIILRDLFQLILQLIEAFALFGGSPLTFNTVHQPFIIGIIRLVPPLRIICIFF